MYRAMWISVTVVIATIVIPASSATKTSFADETLRLVGGATRCSGQVQVKQAGQADEVSQGEWVNVCRTDHWGEAEGRVVCRQLGCGDLVSPYANYIDQVSSFPVWSETVSCAGDEAALANCSSGQDDECLDSYRAGVACHQADEPNAPAMTVRLVNGTVRHSGRVEVYYNGEWGTVCGQYSWSLTDGHVVCRQLGYSGAVAVKDDFHPFGRGTGTILMSLVDCHGDEETLANCSQVGWYRHNCDHYNDAGVICKVPSNGTRIRLADGMTQYEGRVELYYNGEWGTICDDGWNMPDACVVCRQLGFGPALSLGQDYGEGRGAILVSDVGCDGYETSIMDCQKSGWYPSSHCRHHEDAGVQCGIPEDPDVRVRLSDGSRGEGMVEAYHNGEWAAVCGNFFTLSEADVVCRQLGFRKALKVEEPGYYGGAALIIMARVQCAGNEDQLEDCQSVVWYPKHQDCSLDHPAAVTCDINVLPDTVSSVDVRLTGGDVERQGQVELYHNGQWGTVCATGFDMNAANVVCRQLGYYEATYHSSAVDLNDGNKLLLLDSLNCRTGLELNVANCGPLEWYRHDWHNCKPTETAAVTCLGSKMDRDVEIVVRLSNGTDKFSGRVEVYHLGQWGSVCGAELGQNEARVICRQLGHAQGTAVKQYGLYGSGEEPVNVWALTCRGDEKLVENCADVEWYDTSKHVCDEELTAGVVCSDTSKSPKKGTPVYAIAILSLLSVIALVLLVTSAYCIFLRRSKRNAAATQMRYAVLDKQDNSTAY